MLGAVFEEIGSGLAELAVVLGKLAEFFTAVCGDRPQPRFSGNSSGQDQRFMTPAPRAAAGGFGTFAAECVEGSPGQGVSIQEMGKRVERGMVQPGELLAESAEAMGAYLHVVIVI